MVKGFESFRRWFEGQEDCYIDAGGYEHRNDVFRLTELLNPNEKIETPEAVLQDIRHFVELSANEDFSLRQLGVRMTVKELFERLRLAYGLMK